jgi:hypothetical protein
MDTELCGHAVKALRKRLPRRVTPRHFRDSVGHLSLLEGVLAAAASSRGRLAVSVTGEELIPLYPPRTASHRSAAQHDHNDVDNTGRVSIR